MQSLGAGEHEPQVVTRFFAPSPQLLPYFSTYYLTEVRLADGERLTDWLHPEWTNLRFFGYADVLATLGKAEPVTISGFSATGPTSLGNAFTTGSMRLWGIGLLPLGWAKFVGVSAQDYADRHVDGTVDPAFAAFAPLHAVLCGPQQNDPAQQAAFIDRHLLSLLAAAPKDDALVLAAHAALVDPDIAAVSNLVERLGISGRSVERLCKRAFGFPPKLLLRRQRFLRTLAQVMLDPSQRWVNSLDPHYHDQAHFTRDFQRFMGMSARQYMAAPHPLVGAAVHGRMAAAGAAMQALHRPHTD